MSNTEAALRTEEMAFSLQLKTTPSHPLLAPPRLQHSQRSIRVSLAHWLLLVRARLIQGTEGARIGGRALLVLVEAAILEAVGGVGAAARGLAVWEEGAVMLPKGHLEEW